MTPGTAPPPPVALPQAGGLHLMLGPMNNFMVFSQALSSRLRGNRPPLPARRLQPRGDDDPPVAGSCGTSILQDADLTGHDIKVGGRVGAPSNSSEACCTLCSETRGCAVPSRLYRAQTPKSKLFGFCLGCKPHDASVLACCYGGWCCRASRGRIFVRQELSGGGLASYCRWSSEEPTPQFDRACLRDMPVTQRGANTAVRS